MDWVIWTIGGILLLGLIIGIYRGAVRIAVSIVTAVITVLLTFYATPYVAQMVEEKTPLDESIKNYVASSMVEATEDMEVPKNIQIQAIEEADLPDVFKSLLTENNTDEVYQELGVETFAQYAGTFLAKLMIHIVTFLTLFLIITIVLRSIVFALNVVNAIPIFGLVNRMAGGAAGMFCSLLVIWFLMIVVTLVYTTDIGKQILETILGNTYTRILYENNPLLNISIKF